MNNFSPCGPNPISLNMDVSGESCLEEFFDFNTASGPSESEGAQPGLYDYHDNIEFEMDHSMWNEMGPSFQYASNDTLGFGIPDDAHLWNNDSNPVSTGYEAFADLPVGATATTSSAIDSAVNPPWETATNQWMFQDVNSNNLTQIDNSNQLDEFDAPASDSTGTCASPLPRQMTVRCPWPLCIRNQIFQDDGERHFQLHCNELLDAWNGPTKCSWPQCSSKATFKHRHAWATHLKNIHTEPLLCPVSGCKYTKPFGKECDLTRHIGTIHEQNQAHMCPVATCDARTTNFPRKDKLLKHMREKHPYVRCLMNHCGSTVLDGEQALHLSRVHGPYECAFGACKYGLTSQFSRDGLKAHLRTCHNIHWSRGYHILEKLQSADKIAYDESEYPPQSQTDCQICAKNIAAAN